MEMEITQKFEKGFNRSSKIMEYKLGINEARLLSTLEYKHNYWEDENKLIEIDEGLSFYITIPNLQVELNLSPSVIKRCLNKLKKSGLVQIYRKGIPAKNHYILNKDAIENFDAKYLGDYVIWSEEIYESASEDRARFEDKGKGNLSSALMESQIGQNDLTSEVNLIQLDRSKSTVTNNKTTNNKKLKTLTNRINADDDFDHEEQLTELISELQMTQYDDKEDEIKSIYEFLINRVPQFKDYKRSEKDSGLISVLEESSLNSYFLAAKICENARAIIAGSKEARFGNLFVGLVQIKDNMDLKYG